MIWLGLCYFHQAITQNDWRPHQTHTGLCVSMERWKTRRFFLSLARPAFDVWIFSAVHRHSNDIICGENVRANIVYHRNGSILKIAATVGLTRTERNVIDQTKMCGLSVLLCFTRRKIIGSRLHSLSEKEHMNFTIRTVLFSNIIGCRHEM